MVFGSIMGGGGNNREKPGFGTAKDCVAVVTGSSGLCGARLVEMLLERGASTVICFDIQAPDSALQQRFDAAQKTYKGGSKLIVLSGKDGDLTNPAAVEAAFRTVPKIDVCFHIAALVGPFHDRHLYVKVNYTGTLYIIEACRKFSVHKLVFSSSPSTRFTGADIEGLREDELPIPDTFLALYAETKAMAEKEVSRACDNDELFTIAVAPHQVYGPYDNLFLPKLLETSGNGRLRIFGKGNATISVCYVDNYCHGLLCGADACYKDSPALSKFYIVTDGPPVLFWSIINQAGMAMGFTDLEQKWHLPTWFLYLIAYAANVIGALTGKKFKLNPFNVRMLTMHRWFSIDNAKADLKYEPLYTFQDKWQYTVDWFKTNWLPGYLKNNPNAKTTADTKKQD